jgi:hypothetical protein
MARTLSKYLFAALLALLSTQASVPSACLASVVEIVCYSQAEQKAPQTVRPTRAHHPAPGPAPLYASHIKLEPPAAILFQRPPPGLFLFS